MGINDNTYATFKVKSRIHFLSHFGLPAHNPWTFVVDIINWDIVVFDLKGL